jgi:hypothetical protein
MVILEENEDRRITKKARIRSLWRHGIQGEKRYRFRTHFENYEETGYDQKRGNLFAGRVLMIMFVFLKLQRKKYQIGKNSSQKLHPMS